MSYKVTIHIRNPVWSTISGLASEHILKLWNDFGPYKDGFKHMPAYQLGRWDGRIRFFEKTGKVYTRLLSRILPYLEYWKYDIDLIDDCLYYESPNLIDENIFAEYNVLLRPYQVNCANAAINATSGFIIAGTGAGKTLMTAALSKTYSDAGYPCITIVPSADLVEQTTEFYRKVHLNTGIYSGDEKDYDYPNVVATWQALQYNLKVLQNFKTVIWDEAHGCKADVAQKILNEEGKSIPFKFGVTGTFPKPIVDQLSLHSAVGDILITVPARWLMDNGYIAEVEIQTVCIKQKKQEFPDYAAEKSFLIKNTERMDYIADAIITYCQDYGNTLVLVNSVPFGNKLSNLISDAIFLSGANNTEERQEQYDLFEEKDDIIVIATTGIASTGISIDRIKCLIMIDIGKSFTRVIQSIGRGTRLASDKKKVMVIDMYADLKWSRKHFNDRKKYYKEAKYPIIEQHNIKL